MADLRSTGARRGLIISATGTGKTFLSAFDVKAYNPERMLFIVHREQILQKAMTDFKKILGGKNDDYTLLTSKTYNRASKYVFATIQSLAKEERLNSFNKKAFNYILIDESHKVGGHSYQRVVDYFTPDFLLGMTATPERTDAFNIFELFDYNVAYEIRLQGAMEAEMLCPFQYFGVTDYERNGETIDDHTNLDKLVSKERVSHLIEKVEYYGYSGKTLRGLIFCSRKEEANELAVELCHRGYETVALTGSNSIAEREAAVDQLEQGTIKYIVTVDIFNEGIDIPSVNQVVMLRQTQSSIIFVQQLGRGLRKSNDKEYVTIIDFIGNYKNNYLIPIALTGDTSKNKDNIRHKMSQLNYMSGLSTINFEEIAKQRIFSSINQVKLNSMVALKEAYFGLKQRLGYQPKLTDFIMNDSIDPEVIIKAKKNVSCFFKCD
ncbi:DEAD/DEAH box helicase [Brochothrix campestris]|uniref:DEAD/DEAH box helicase n=1 Tax=Brochothrix campestris TaxID=2757 RepID=UPI0038BD0388